MADQHLPDISVGDYAARILEEMKTSKTIRKVAPPVILNEDIKVPDVSNIKVGDSFVEKVMEQAFGQKNDSKVSEKEPESVVQEPSKNLTEEKIALIINGFSALIKEAKKVIEELSAGATTVGNIGVNTAGPQKKKKKTKKDNPWAICHSSTGPEKSPKFERCVKHVKAKK